MKYKKLINGELLETSQSDFNNQLNQDYKYFGRCYYYKSPDQSFYIAISPNGLISYSETPNYSPLPFSL